MSFDAEKPYNDLPLLPPERSQWETFEVYQQLSGARAALAELKGRSPVIPNSKMLINTLVLQEAKDSSSIENIFTSTDKLYKAFSASSVEPDPQTKEVLRYRFALWDAWQNMLEEGLSIELIENIYRKIKEKTDGVRDSQVYLGNSSKIVYTPPCCREVLTSKLNNWIDFAKNDNTIDPLIKMAILHYQFEAIHPFTDGNGRTGRVLNVLYLCNSGLLDQPILYLSKYINENKAEYYRLLRDVTENGNWAAWIVYHLKAVNETSQHTLGKVNAIHSLFQQTLDKVKAELPKIYRYELIELLFHQPYCKINMITEAGLGSRNSAAKYLTELENAGILSSERMGKETLYLNVELYKLLAKG